MELRKLKIIFIYIIVLKCSFAYSQETYEDILKRTYAPVNQEIYDTIVALDKQLFDAYNSCDMATQAALYSEDLEFFHDEGGLTTSKKEVLNALELYICDKVTRTLIEGSIEVYPIKGYGAIEMGYHTFNNKNEPDNKSTASRFVLVWKNQGEKWVITKVISLH